MARLSGLIATLQKIQAEGVDYKVFFTTDGILYEKMFITWDTDTLELVISSQPTDVEKGE